MDLFYMPSQKKSRKYKRRNKKYKISKKIRISKKVFKNRSQKRGGADESLASKANAADNNKTKKNLGSMAGQLSSSAVDAASTAASVAFIGQMAISGLSATGVGLPVAGVLAVTLFLANKLMTMMVNNLMFIGVLFDTMNITTNFYLLYDLIDKRSLVLQLALYYSKHPTDEDDMSKFYVLVKKEGMGTDLDVEAGIDCIKLRMKNTYEERKKEKFTYVALNEEIKERIIDKLSVITKTLMELAPNDVVRMLSKDQTIQNKSLKDLVAKESATRRLDKPKSMFNSLRKGIDKAARGMTRFTSSKYYQDMIVKDLSILEGFFLLLKAEQDEGILLYQNKYGTTDWWKKTWDAIEEMKEYRDYLFPLSTEETVNLAKQDMAETSAEASKAIEMVMVDAMKKDDKEEAATDNAAKLGQ